jgi:Meckel syndrome type 1 protein
MYPGISSAVNDLSGKDVNKIAHKLEHRDVRRVLLEFGDKSPAVKALQKKLEIPEDGVFGPQTKAAVRDFQKSAGLATTGDVDVKTWLKLFPGDMIVYAPPGAANALGAKSAQTPQWTAVNAADPAAALASVSDRRGAHKGSKSNARSRTRDALAHAASFPGLTPDQGQQPSGTDLPGPTGTAPDVTPPVGPPVSPTPPSGEHGGVLAPGGGVPTPQAPPSFPNPGGSVGQILKTIIAAADHIDGKGYAYSWGGGHNMGFSGPYDCSGAVSAVLHAAGLLKRPMVSGEFMHWGAPGPGSVTIYANAGHVYMSILGRYFGTSSANPGGGAGWFNGGPRPGFAVVHVPFSAMHLKDVAAEKRKKAKLRAKKRRAAKRRAAQREAASAPYNGPSGGTAAGTSSGQQAPDQGSQPSPDAGPQPAPQQSAPAPAPVPTPAPPPAPVNPAPAPAPVTPAPPVQPQGSAPAQQAPAQQAPAPQQSAPAQQAPAQQAPAQPAPQQSAPAPAPAQQAPAQPAPQPAAPSTPAPQAPAVPAPQAPAQPAPQPSAPSTPAPQAPAPQQSAPAGSPAAAQPATPPATAPKPAGGDSAGGNSGAAASG